MRESSSKRKESRYHIQGELERYKVNSKKNNTEIIAMSSYRRMIVWAGNQCRRCMKQDTSNSDQSQSCESGRLIAVRKLHY